jgi:hypothetical protein
MKTEIRVQLKEFNGANIIRVTAGTNCPQGGDTGHGGRTAFGIKDLGSTDMRISINGGEMYGIDSFMLVFGGDSEFDTFVDALKFALKTFKKMKESDTMEVL